MENSSGVMLDCMSFEHLLQVQKGGSFDSVVSPTSLGHHTVLHWTLKRSECYPGNPPALQEQCLHIHKGYS